MAVTLDEAIRHCYEVYHERGDMCKECREEHRQLAQWLEELKQYKTADVAEVVRCEKCKHGEVSIISKTIDGEKRIACYCNLGNKVTSVDWYCPSGERRC